MYCPSCGSQIEDNVNFCTKCGKPLSSVNSYGSYRPVPTEESINIWLVLLAIIFPLFGFIYWPMEYKNRPRTAKACGIAAIISFLVSMAFSFLSFSIFSKFFYDFMDWLLYSNNL